MVKMFVLVWCIWHITAQSTLVGLCLVPQSVVCVYISGEDSVWYVCEVLFCSAWMCCLEEVYKCLQL